MNIAPPILVQTPSAWHECLAVLSQQPRLAVDTESNSLYAYQERVCLIQISATGQDYVIDPLALPDLDGLGGLMADPAVEKVFHAAEYDVLCLKRDFGFDFANLFDTMLAARVLGWKQLGLASILTQEFDVQLNKRYQRANWGRRPLLPEQIDYARLDTHYLPDLRDRLAQALDDAGRMEEAREHFQQVAEVSPNRRTFDPDDFWSLLGGRYQLAPQQNAVLRELYVFREREAQRRDWPAFKILSNQTLVELAEAMPRYLDEFQGIHGMTSRVVQRYGSRLLEVIGRGLRTDPPRPPQQTQPSEPVLARYGALHTWRKERAQERGVESDVIVSKKALWEIACRDPKTAADLRAIKALGEWPREAYGGELLAVLAQVRRH